MIRIASQVKIMAAKSVYESLLLMSAIMPTPGAIGAPPAKKISRNPPIEFKGRDPYSEVLLYHFIRSFSKHTLFSISAYCP